MGRPDENLTDKPASGDKDPRASRWDIARWVLAAVIAVVAAVFYFHAVDHQSICHQQLAGESGTVVELCGPPRLLDLVPFAFLIAIVLWPDLGELAVAGLFTLRRRVAAQEERQRAVEERLLHFDQQLTQMATLSQLQGQSQRQTGIETVNLFPPDQGELKRAIDSKEAPAAPGPAAPPAGTEEVAAAEASLLAEADERLRLLGEFVREYARLEPYMVSPRSPLYGRLEDELDVDRRQVVKDWLQMFDREITALRQTRNATIHQPELVSAETLRDAIDNTRELSRILFERIG